MIKMAIKISVIVPTYNRAEKLKRCIHSLLRQDYDKKNYEIIIVNDSSSDNTIFVASRLVKKHSNIRLINNKTNNGPAYSRNQGIKKAKGRIIAFTDDDCVAHKNWLAQIERSHRIHPEELAIGGNVLSLNNSIISKFRDFQRLYSLKISSVKNGHFAYLPTCNISYKKRVFEKVGYFDENLYPSEDFDFNIRLLMVGKPVYLDKKIAVFHEHESSIKDFILKSYSYGIFIPPIKMRHPGVPLIAPLNFLSWLAFLLATFASIPLKILSVDGFINKIRLLPYIILDELAYRAGVIRGLSKIQS